jgi:hypothetical protein
MEVKGSAVHTGVGRVDQRRVLDIFDSYAPPGASVGMIVRL